MAAALNGLVLLAEAHPANRRLIGAQLEKLGYQVETVSNGVEALKAVEPDPKRFEMVLVNCQLPELSGVETAKAIRWLERQWGGRIPIIAFSAEVDDVETCSAVGIDGVLTGPVTLQGLREVIADVKAGVQARQTEQSSGLPQENGILDGDTIAGLRRLNEDGEGDFLTQVIDIFLRDSTVWMDQIRSAARDGDTAGLRKAVHTLKGSSGSLGARRLSDVCLQFEQRIDRGEAIDWEQWVGQVEEAYEQTRAALMAERRE